MGVYVYDITLQFLPREVRALLFGGLGLALLGFSFYMLQRSILGPFIPGGDRSLADVLYSNRIMSRGPRVVAIGGGHGLSTLLRGLKESTGNLPAVVTVAADGGASGRPREGYRMRPPGGTRPCLLALPAAAPPARALCDPRFAEGRRSRGASETGADHEDAVLAPVRRAHEFHFETALGPQGR